VCCFRVSVGSAFLRACNILTKWPFRDQHSRVGFHLCFGVIFEIQVGRIQGTTVGTGGCCDSRTGNGGSASWTPARCEEIGCATNRQKEGLMSVWVALAMTERSE
jgi:hypothetical protein